MPQDFRILRLEKVKFIWFNVPHRVLEALLQHPVDSQDLSGALPPGPLLGPPTALPIPSSALPDARVAVMGNGELPAHTPLKALWGGPLLGE